MPFRDDDLHAAPRPRLLYARSVENEQIRSPWYVRAWGWILLLWGLLNLFVISTSLAPLNDPRTDSLSTVAALSERMTTTDFIFTAVVLAVAIGLLTESRWGWFLGMIVGILGISVGTWVILDVSIYGGDITFIGAEIFALFFLVIPGLLLLLSLLTIRTRTWLRNIPH